MLKQVGTVTDVFTYDAPSLSSYRLANGMLFATECVLLL